MPTPKEERYYLTGAILTAKEFAERMDEIAQSARMSLDPLASVDHINDLISPKDMDLVVSKPGLSAPLRQALEAIRDAHAERTGRSMPDGMLSTSRMTGLEEMLDQVKDAPGSGIKLADGTAASPDSGDRWRLHSGGSSGGMRGPSMFRKRHKRTDDDDDTPGGPGPKTGPRLA